MALIETKTDDGLVSLAASLRVAMLSIKNPGITRMGNVKMRTDINSVNEKVSALLTVDDDGVFQFGALTYKDSLVKSRLTKLPTPMNYQRIWTLRKMLVVTGRKYMSLVNDGRLMEGKDATFVPQSTYCEPVGTNGLVYKHKEKDQYYLRVYPNLCKQFNQIVVYYDANGGQLTDEQYKTIQKEYLALVAPVKSQGLNELVVANNYKIENVYLIKRGNEGFDATPKEIDALLKELV
jgi:hypothetical protein